MFERISRLARDAMIVALMLAPAAAVSGGGADTVATPPAGLMWNRTGLPAVFPLQVKTPPGQDHVLTLIDADTGTDALAAYIKGGAFFKVLVPPGTYRLTFAFGDVWHGREDLFGPGGDTRVFELRRPLTFETRGLGVKAGHVVDLSTRRPGEIAGVMLKDQLICQSFRLRFPPRDISDPANVRQLDGVDYGVGDTPRYALNRPLLSTQPRRDLRSRYCG